MSTTAEAIQHPVVSQEEWIRASQELLAKEKEFTHQRDEMSKTRRALPWAKVDKNYTFEGNEGRRSLSELFGDKAQLIVYHFMYSPGDKEGCPGCSFVSDHFDAARQHFQQRDIAFAVVSRAPLQEFQAFKKRMGWNFPWYSSAGTTFNYDFGVSFRPEDLAKGEVMYNFKMQKLKGEEQPGLSVFYKAPDGQIYRTYSTYERGLDMLLGAYNFIDLTPKGRDESGGMSWVRFHDEYGN